jgi:hypothetical protein
MIKKIFNPKYGDQMGQLWELSEKINELIAKKGLDKMTTRGKIGLKSGVMLAFTKDSPDDPEKIKKIKAAAQEVLGEAV